MCVCLASRLGVSWHTMNKKEHALSRNGRTTCLGTTSSHALGGSGVPLPASVVNTIGWPYTVRQHLSYGTTRVATDMHAAAATVLCCSPFCQHPGSSCPCVYRHACADSSSDIRSPTHRARSLSGPRHCRLSTPATVPLSTKAKNRSTRKTCTSSPG